MVALYGVPFSSIFLTLTHLPDYLFTIEVKCAGWLQGIVKVHFGIKFKKMQISISL